MYRCKNNASTLLPIFKISGKGASRTSHPYLGMCTACSPVVWTLGTSLQVTGGNTNYYHTFTDSHNGSTFLAIFNSPNACSTLTGSSGTPATRTRVHWQPYTSISAASCVSIPSRSLAPYLITPTASVSSPPPIATPSSDLDHIRQSLS
jgi:hypothetical protein